MNDMTVKALEKLIVFANFGVHSMQSEPEYNNANKIGKICRESVEECLISIDVITGVIARYEKDKNCE